MPPHLTFATLTLAVGLLSCAPVKESPRAASRRDPRDSLAVSLSRATGMAVQVEREKGRDGWSGYFDETRSLIRNPDEGRQLANAIFGAVRGALEIDPKLLGPVHWGGHRGISACVAELWPGTEEPTTSVTCIDFDDEYRPRWVFIGWSAAIAARRDVIKPSRDILAALKAKAPADVLWNANAQLVLEGNRPVYVVGSTAADTTLETTFVDASTGAVIEVRRHSL